MIPAGGLRGRAVVDHGALRHNARLLAAQSGGAGLVAVVKADAYGHGAIPVVRTLGPQVLQFAVACPEEAAAIRPHAAGREILLLGPALPGERAAIVAAGFIPTVSTVAEAESFSRLAPPGRRVRLQVAVDTGMGRLGFWWEEAAAGLAAIRRLPGVEIESVSTHLPCADEDEAFTRTQLELFAGQVDEWKREVLPPATPVHVFNSAGCLGGFTRCGERVRPGLALYGVAPRPEWQDGLRPVLTWSTRVTLVRELGPGRGISYGRTFITPRPMRVACLAVGYADGYPRQVSGRGACVLVRGRRCPLLGRVTMDQILIDVSGLDGVPEPGEEAVLLGRQAEGEIPATELAGWAGTIAWDVLAGIGPRVARLHVGAD